jgi:hypothetical protein
MTVSIRGLGTTNDNPGVDSAVGYSQDGIYAAHPEALTPVLFDIKRIEAVLGPQGTLYGRNTNGGVNALDPHGILAPGKSGIWGRRERPGARGPKSPSSLSS